MAFLEPAVGSGRKARQRAISNALADLPSIEAGKARILAVLDQATDLERHDGERWYSTANHIARQVAETAGHRGNVQLGAGLLAALSPQTSWDKNIIRAFSAAEDGSDGPWTADCASKALGVLSGADPAIVLGGRKVRSFYANILGNESAVTIDRHAVAVVYNRSLSDRDIKILERPGAYLFFAGLYRSVARELGIPASTLQAIVWIVWRRIKNLDYDSTVSF